MSFRRDGPIMDNVPLSGGSVRKARERAEAELRGKPIPPNPRPPQKKSNAVATTATIATIATLSSSSSASSKSLKLPIMSPSARPPRSMLGASSSSPVVGSSSVPSRPRLRPTNAMTRGDDGRIGVAISSPIPVPQWPLSKPSFLPTASTDPKTSPSSPPIDSLPSRPPLRPERPSNVPSLLDGTRIQEPTPVFQYQRPLSDRSPRISEPNPYSSSSSSRPSTLSSVGFIPDFPVPLQMTAPHPPPQVPLPQPPRPPPLSHSGLPMPRRSASLRPPPSARRGDYTYSSFTFVTPIPEERSPSRSAWSIAPRGAMLPPPPDLNLNPSPKWPAAFYDDSLSGDGSFSDNDERDDEDGDDDDLEDIDKGRLVRSVSIGKRGRPTLVTTSSSVALGVPGTVRESSPIPSPTQLSPFHQGTAYLESPSTSPVAPTKANTVTSAIVSEQILDAAGGGYDYTSSSDALGLGLRSYTPSPQPPPLHIHPAYSRFSAIRRPLRLDADVPMSTDSIVSLTSLPELIRRAGRLRANLERGRRPASHLDDLHNEPNELPPRNAPEVGGVERARGSGSDSTVDRVKYESGISDILAAFPPPAQAGHRASHRRGSSFIQSWPLPFTSKRTNGESSTPPPVPVSRSEVSRADSRKSRRCWGVPPWVLILIAFILLAAAVLVPVGLLVIAPEVASNRAVANLKQCQQELECANGGTNVVIDNVCSCICTNGFVGRNCTVFAKQGCTMTSLADPSLTNTNLSNVTIGSAIPRLILDSQANFSVPLDATAILGKFNYANLSCAAENALVTFPGINVLSQASVNDTAADEGGDENASATATAAGVDIVVVAPSQDNLPPIVIITLANPSAVASAGTITTVTVTATATVAPAMTATPSPTASTGSANTPVPTSAFTITNQVLDFSRVAVLFVLQEDTLQNATDAQRSLATFFASTTGGGLATKTGSGATIEQARNVTLGHGNSIDLVNFRLDIGQGVIL